MKRSGKITLIVIGSILGATILTVAGVYTYLKLYDAPTQVDKIENDTGLVKAHNRGLYDKDGNRLKLKGVNAGNVLLQEGWMSPFANEPIKNEDGTYKKDNDNNLQYNEYAQETFLNDLKNNPNLKDKEEELKEYYYKSFFSENDFKIIKEELGLNTIRLPFYWRNILNDDFSRKEESVAFSYLDWFLTNCKNNELYCVLDLHGVPGSQNAFEHSGYLVDEPGFWDNEEYINTAIDIWDYVSNYYTNKKSDLGKYIVTYDVLNEPDDKKNNSKSDRCIKFYDRIYKTIRANNDNHVITFEGIWTFAKLPNPNDYKWENVMYSYHFYNWKHDIISTEVFKLYEMIYNIGRDYNVPTFVGEFTGFDDMEAWKDTIIHWYDDYEYNWTIWSYKTTVTGWWTSSWGVYTNTMNLDTSKEETKVLVKTCSEEEFKKACDDCKTSNCKTGTLYNFLKEYKETNNK